MEQLSVRVSDADRREAETRLRDACADGRLSPEELSERLQLAFQARTAADLDVVLGDLPLRRPVRARYASWLNRVAALLIDEVVIGLIAGAASLSFSARGLALGVAALTVSVAYFTVMHGSRRGQTLGKRCLGIAVRREDGGRLGYGRALGRTLVLLASAGFFPVIGFPPLL